MEASIVDNAAELQHPLAEEKTRILLVDDEPNILLSLSRLLSSRYEDCLIETASTAEKALQMLSSTVVDLVITDFRLPEMDGLELSARIRASSPKTRLILMTAYGTGEMVHSAGDSGCVGYLEKPLDIEQLMQLVDRARASRSRVRLQLSDISLPDIVQLYSLKQESATLSINGGGSRGTVYIEKGEVTHAEYARLRGAEALSAILDFPSAEVSALECAPPRVRTLSLSWFSLSAAAQESSEANRTALLQHPDQAASAAERAFRRERSPDPDRSISDLVANFKLHRKATIDPKPSTRISSDGLKKPEPIVSKKTELKLSEPEELRLPLGTEPQVSQDTELQHSENRKAHRVRSLVNSGVRHFRHHRLDKAAAAWQEALRLDPECEQAGANLEILKEVVRNGRTIQ